MMRDRDHDIFFLDQVLDPDLILEISDFGLSCIAEFFFDLEQLFFDHFETLAFIAALNDVERRHAVVSNEMTENGYELARRGSVDCQRDLIPALLASIDPVDTLSGEFRS